MGVRSRRRHTGRPRTPAGQRRTQRCVSLHEQVIARLQARADALDRSFSSLVDEILLEWTVRNFEEEAPREPANPSSTLNIS